MNQVSTQNWYKNIYLSVLQNFRSMHIIKDGVSFMSNNNP